MKKFFSGLFTVLFLLGLTAPVPLWADTPRVLSLDIYPRGARFVFEFDAPKGAFQLELPGAFDSGSVRVLNAGEGESLKVRSEQRPGWIPPSLQALRARVKEQEKAVSALKARRDSCLQTRRILDSSQPKDIEGKDLILYIEDAQALRLRTENELAEIERELEDEKRKLELLEDRFASLQPEDSEEVLLLEGNSALGGRLLVEAFTPAAFWRPRYRLNLDSRSGVISGQMLASVRQRTGLDSAGPITFHTKRPIQTVTPPKVDPLRVSLRAPVRARRGDGLAPGEGNMLMKNAPMAMEEQAPISVAPPEFETNISDRSIESCGTLEGNGEPEELILGEFRLESRLLLVLIPEKRDEAWIVASMDQIADPLVPGEADLTVDGTPSGTTLLPPYGQGQTRIPFGAAPQVTARKIPSIETTASSWFGSSGVAKNGFVIEVTNGMKQEQEVTVRDRLPFPTNEKIRLEVSRMDPKPTERDGQNRLTWKLNLGAGETQKIFVDYSLSYPSSETLQYQD